MRNLNRTIPDARMTRSRSIPAPSRSRWFDVTLRIISAVPLGYAVASLWAMALARMLPGARSEATVTGTLVALALCAFAAMYAFAARSGARAFCMLLILGAIAGGITWLSISAGGRL